MVSFNMYCGFRELPKFPAQAFGLLGAPLTLLRPGLPELIAATSENKGVILEGPNGAGKSMLLLQLASLWLEADHRPLLYFPSLVKAARGYWPYEPSPSVVYEQPGLAEHIFAHCFGGDKLGSLEACLADPNTRIILDEVNWLFQPTAYRTPEGSPLPVEQLRVLRMLKERVLAGHGVVGAVCRHDPQAKKDPLPPVSTLRSLAVPGLSLSECQTLLSLYHRLGMLALPPDARVTGMLHLVSGGSGVDLLRAIRYDTLYLANPEFK